MTAAEAESEPSEAAPAQVSAVSEEQTPEQPQPTSSMSDAPTRPAQTSLESKPDAGSAPPGALRAFYGRSKDLAAGIFKEVSYSSSALAGANPLSTQPLLQPALCTHLKVPLQRKPWAELFDRTAFSRPGNFAEVCHLVSS